MGSSLAHLLRGVLAAYPDPILLLEPGGRILVASRAAREAFAFDDSVVRSLSDLRVGGLHVERLENALARVCTTAASVRDEAVWPTARGLRHYEVTLSPALSGQGDVEFVTAMFHDVTLRKPTEFLLREREEFFSQIFQKGPLGVAIISPSRRIVRVNTRLCEMLEFTEDELVGVTFDELTHVEDRESASALAARLFAGEMTHYRVEQRYLRKSGEPLWAAITGSVVADPDGQPLYGLAMIEDIDDRRRMQAERDAMEQRIREVQKLESLGVLAGGIAHDFNNLLVPILGNAELLGQELPEGSPAQFAIRDIIIAANRAAYLARQMLAYSGKGRFVVRRVDLSRAVVEIAPLLRASLRPGHSLELQLAPDLPLVEADTAQIQQLVSNLVLNATEAIPGRSGTIVVRTSTQAVSQEVLDQAYLASDLSAGAFVRLTVTDNGSGMDEQARSRMFDPFFSTKGIGRGLGLPAVLGIVRGHLGAVLVESQPGEGTSITVLFQPADRSEGVFLAVPTTPETWTGSGMLLLLEADDSLRSLTQRMLQRSGFEVIPAAGGAEALDQFARHAPRLRAALIDLRASQLSGLEVCRRLRTDRPDLPVIALIGGSALGSLGTMSDWVTTTLQKPFTIQALRTTLRQALGE